MRNFMLRPALPSIWGGLQIVESLEMVDMVEDWSGVRSHARARRRRKRHPQRIRIVAVPKKEAIQIGDKLIMHPAVAAQLLAKIGGPDHG